MSTESPYQPPKSVLVDAHQGELRRKGRYVVLKPELEWPSRCFKCNTETSLKKEVRLTYINPWIYLSILITVLLTIILALIFRKKFTENLPICEGHIKKRKNFLVFQWAMVAVMTAGIVIGSLTEMKGFFVVSGIVFLLIVISSIFARLAFAAKYKNGILWVTGSGKEFRNSLPDFIA